MKQFLYKIHNFSDKQSKRRIQTKISKLGEAGWELCAIDGERYFFKKVAPEN